MVFRADLPLTTRPIPALDILLVVEVVSHGSRREDRGSKPIAHAEAGIPHFWRVEGPTSGAPSVCVHTFELDRTRGGYTASGEYVDRLITTSPGRLDIDLSRLTF
ncbi:Putative restriction endonuclease [Streptoalloteichus hindustanus]|uniref:Putative restriction endonuclease n=1 Tax=Streptoalloteichus hindustanus TaxID=2017 RepID=A0A1M5J3B7_STRHI|nr:Putative restriction endonuclease [Streptoalloteichus hindustanus]